MDGEYDPFAPRQAADAKTAEASTLPADHNERAQYEEQTFLRCLTDIQGLKGDVSQINDEINKVFKHLKTFGFSKQDIKWAMELETKDAPEVIATMQRRVRIAKMLGHGVARQMEIFDKDRTPLVDRAYEEGLNVGKLRKQMVCPYDLGSEAGQAWQRGVNDGNAFINQDLASVIEDEFQAAAE